MTLPQVPSRWSRPLVACCSALLIAAVAYGCAEATDKPPADRFDRSGTTTKVEDSLPYDPTTEVDVEGETDISDLLDTRYPPDADPVPAWFGYAPDYPYPLGETRGHGEVCDSNFGNKVFELDSLPTTISGVVTMFPQFYQKLGICGQDHRFYGNYFLQDSTGSILVLKDSRIADFTVGDRVELRVLGITKQFGRVVVVASDQEKVVARADEEDLGAPVEVLTDQTYAERFDRDSGSWSGGKSTDNCWDIVEEKEDTEGDETRVAGFDVPPGFGDTYRVSGLVCQEPTNTNFNNLVVHGGIDSCDEEADTKWPASLGLELGRRGTNISRGDEITITGPVYGQLVGLAPDEESSAPGSDIGCEWTFRLAATRIGQIAEFN